MKKKLAGLLLSTLFVVTSPAVVAQMNGADDRGSVQGQGAEARMERDALDASALRNKQERNRQAVEADNTANNKDDRDKSSITAGQQSNDRRDIVITQKIRQDLVDNQDLSDYGKNVKVITNSGKVVLRGPVNTVKERNAVELIARNIAGAKNVDNKITVKK